MDDPQTHQVERLQRLVARIVATSPVGHRLCLIGGYRFRLLDQSCRRSLDLDYHWEGDLDAKRDLILGLMKQRLLPAVARSFDYEGRAEAAQLREEESPALRGVHLAFWRPDVPYSRIEIPVEITRIPCHDPTTVRTADGVVYPTISDADAVEGKVLALFNRHLVQHRDFVDLFLFSNRLLPESAGRVAAKLASLGVSGELTEARLRDFAEHGDYHSRSIDTVIRDQLDPSAAANLRSAGGGSMVLHSVCEILIQRLRLGS